MEFIILNHYRFDFCHRVLNELYTFIGAFHEKIIDFNPWIKMSIVQKFPKSAVINYVSRYSYSFFSVTTGLISIIDFQPENLLLEKKNWLKKNIQFILSVKFPLVLKTENCYYYYWLLSFFEILLFCNYAL